jgi:hypothetical protein
MGIIVMFAISVAAFRRARMTGRSTLIWVPMVWLMGLAAGTLAAMIGGCIALATAADDAADPPLAAVLGMAIGNIAGSAIAAWCAGRPMRR